MSLNNRCVAFLLVISALAAGCATAVPAVRLSPSSAEVAWAGNRASVRKTNTGVRVAAALEHPDARVGVEIQNGKAERVEVESQGLALSVGRASNADMCSLPEQ
jgi:hypothetical protein